MKTHLISTFGKLWEWVDETTYDSYLHNCCKDLIFKFHIKAYDCINLIKEYASKYGIFHIKYGENNRQKLKEINLFLEQCNEAYILRKYHIKQEMQHLEQKYKEGTVNYGNLRNN